MNEQQPNIFGTGEDIDLGSSTTPEDFDPFADVPETTTSSEPEPPQPPAPPVIEPQAPPAKAADATTKPAGATVPAEAANPLAQAMNVADNQTVEAARGNLFSRAPKFVYANAEEDIADASKTFEELRLDKATDFPELEDGKRVSWSVEYGKINKAVSDPKGTTISKMKTQIEQSKDFLEALKKMKIEDRDKAVCKVKPRVTAQSKGEINAYKGVFNSLADAEASGKVISIIPARDGLVYERRQNEIGTFITPVNYVPELSEVSAGFFPALPRIPVHQLRMIIGFFRHMMQGNSQYEALVHIVWDKEDESYQVIVPKQTVTKVSVDAQLEQEYDPNHYIHVMDIHSHNSMPAKFSSVDNEDEKATRLYAVIGKLDRFLPDINVRISNGGKYLAISPETVFEGFDAEYPDLWPDNITMPSKSYARFMGTVRVCMGEGDEP